LAGQSPQTQTPQRAEKTHTVAVSRRSTTAGQCAGKPALHATLGHLLTCHRIETDDLKKGFEVV